MSTVSSGGGGFQPVFIKLTSPELTQSSEGTALNEPTWQETIQYNLFTAQELKNEIAQEKQFHLRPISDNEYSQILTMLKTGKDQYGKSLYQYQKAALARVVKENVEKWFPDLLLDEAFDEALKSHESIDSALRSLYLEALEGYRDPYITTKAEEVVNLYNPEEVQRLRSQGIAFLDESFKNYESIKTFGPNPLPIPESYVKKSFQHPMLKYNLVKGKK